MVCSDVQKHHIENCNRIQGHTYQSDVEVLVHFEDAEVGSRREGGATVCDANVGGTIHCKANARTGLLNPDRL